MALWVTKDATYILMINLANVDQF